MRGTRLLAKLQPERVDRTTLAWCTAVTMLAEHHHTGLDRQVPAADALLRELGVHGLAQLHTDIHAGAPIDYRFTRCPYCVGLGEDPNLPDCSRAFHSCRQEPIAGDCWGLAVNPISEPTQRRGRITGRLCSHRFDDDALLLMEGREHCLPATAAFRRPT